MCENDLLNEIKKYQFYAVELNLYLDNFPNNSKATNDYKIVSKKLDNLIILTNGKKTWESKLLRSIRGL